MLKSSPPASLTCSDVLRNYVCKINVPCPSFNKWSTALTISISSLTLTNPPMKASKKNHSTLLTDDSLPSK